MQIDPISPEGLAFIADHLGATYTDEDREHFIEGELIRCEECREFYTSESDFDRDATEYKWLCNDCSADPDNAPYDLAKHEGTYR